MSFDPREETKGNFTMTAGDNAEISIIQQNSATDKNFPISISPMRSRQGSETERPLNSSIKKKKGGKLTILESGVQVIRDGVVLNNDSLLNNIRVPDKI